MSVCLHYNWIIIFYDLLIYLLLLESRELSITIDLEPISCNKTWNIDPEEEVNFCCEQAIWGDREYRHEALRARQNKKWPALAMGGRTLRRAAKSKWMWKEVEEEGTHTQFKTIPAWTCNNYKFIVCRYNYSRDFYLKENLFAIENVSYFCTDQWRSFCLSMKGFICEWPSKIAICVALQVLFQAPNHDLGNVDAKIGAIRLSDYL